MKKIVVTGGAGFVGSHLCERLTGEGTNQVWSIDNYSTGSTSNHVPGVEYVNCETEDIQRVIKFEPDIVYHLGEYSRVELSFEEIETVFHSNRTGTYAVIKFCQERGAKLVYAGSSTRFADENKGGKQSPYAWSKESNTDLIQCFSDWYGLDYAIAYFYNVYGGREISTGRYATLVGLFKQKYLQGEPLGIVSPGTQRRNFTHVEDIVDGLILVGEKGSGNDFGIGSPESYSVLEIASLFKCDTEMLPARKGNRMSAPLVTERTEALGWRATRSISEHIAEFVRNSKR